MEVAFTVKNTSRAIKPKRDDILIHDGKIWYVTTKEELFKEYKEHIREMVEEKEQMKKEINELKAEIASQMLEYGELIRDFITNNKGE